MDYYSMEQYMLAKIIKAVMQSAAEAKCGTLYKNAKEVVQCEQC